MIRPRRSKKYFVRNRKVVFSKGPIHLVDCKVLMPSGRLLSRQILEHPGSVVIIPRISKKRFLLIRQFRFAVRGWLWEFPAGGIEKGESPRKAACRELIEETGYCPGRLGKLRSFFPTPGISGEVMHLFLAENLFPAQGLKDEDEELEVREVTGPQLEAMVRSGRIKDAKTVLGYFYLAERKLLGR